MVPGLTLAALASLTLASQEVSPAPPSEVGMLASIGFMSGCVASVAQNKSLPDVFAGTQIERVDRPQGLPVADLAVDVWRVPHPSARIYVYGPPGDPSECYVSVFDASVEDVVPTVRTLLAMPDSPFVEGETRQVEGTGAAMITYGSRAASFPVVMTMIANGGADTSIPSVQLALKRIP
jgi:hypothetical protein